MNLTGKAILLPKLLDSFEESKSIQTSQLTNFKSRLEKRSPDFPKGEATSKEDDSLEPYN